MKAFLLALAITLSATASLAQSSAITVRPKGVQTGGITHELDFDKHLAP
ncbi:MAG TPA: hypothetical protein VGT08_16730 [Terracidiphilus sp.]|nr:hypothetical protein [Terracidiphilus sp.]